MKAVITAILTDPEARDTATATYQSAIWQGTRVAAALYGVGAGLHGAIAQRTATGWAAAKIRFTGWARCRCARQRSSTGLRPGYVPPGTSIAAAGLLGPELQMTNVTTVVGYINYMQGAIGAQCNRAAPDVFASYDAELGLASTPTALVDRINLLLMAGQMNSTLYSQIVNAVSAIAIPTGDQNAINAALAAPCADGDLSDDGVARLHGATIGSPQCASMTTRGGSF